MPIPDFDGILNVLPPHLGDPSGNMSDLSPYSCSTQELCEKFATSLARRGILEGFLKLRAELMALGLRGFQWLDGSFVEDIEAQAGRDPNDIDVVTFIAVPNNKIAIEAILIPRPDLWHRPAVKSAFYVDQFLFPLYRDRDPESIVNLSRYWYGLFSHRRDPERTWKGMLRVELADKNDDDLAWQVLGSNP